MKKNILTLRGALTCAALSIALVAGLVPAQALSSIALAAESGDVPSAAAEEAAADGARTAEAEQAIAPEEAANEAVAADAEGEPAAEAAQAEPTAQQVVQGSITDAAEVDIVSASVQLQSDAALISYNGLVYATCADDDEAVSLVGWTGVAPTGAVAVPERIASGSATYVVKNIGSHDPVGGGFCASSVEGEQPAVGLAADEAGSDDGAASAPDPYATDLYADADKAPGVASITIPTTVESVDPAFFQLFPNAASIAVDAGNQHLTSYNGMLFGTDDAGEPTDLLLVPEGMEGAAVLPSSVAAVPACVITRCTKLQAIEFPTGSTANARFATWNGILYTADKATLLAAPAGLGASATIAPECTAIAAGAFWGNTELKTITSAGAVAEIAMGGDAAGDGADAAVPAFNGDAIGGATVLAAERAAWEAAGFTRFADAVEAGQTIASLDQPGLAYILQDDSTLAAYWEGSEAAPEALVIPATVELDGVAYRVSAIREGGFAEQAGLRAVELPAGLTAIAPRAFAGSGLASMSIPGSVARIGDAAFEGCASLAEIELNEGTRTIGASAFAGTAAASVTLPASVAAVGAHAFAGCGSLQTVLDLGRVPEVDASALAECSGVSVYVPINEAGDYAWNLGAPAANNHLMPYGVKASAEPISLAQGESADLFEGGYLEAPGEVKATSAYKSNVSVTDNRTVTGKQLGTTPVTTTLTLGDIQLASTTQTARVTLAAEDQVGSKITSSSSETLSDFGIDESTGETIYSINGGFDGTVFEGEDVHVNDALGATFGGTDGDGYTIVLAQAEGEIVRFSDINLPPSSDLQASRITIDASNGNVYKIEKVLAWRVLSSGVLAVVEMKSGSADLRIRYYSSYNQGKSPDRYDIASKFICYGFSFVGNSDLLGFDCYHASDANSGGMIKEDVYLTPRMGRVTEELIINSPDMVKIEKSDLSSFSDSLSTADGSAGQRIPYACGVRVIDNTSLMVAYVPSDTTSCWISYAYVRQKQEADAREFACFALSHGDTNTTLNSDWIDGYKDSYSRYGINIKLRTQQQVTYNANGGSWSDGNTKTRMINAYRSVGEYSPAPTLSGSSLKGWALSANSTETVTFPQQIISDITYYAIWEKSTFTITIDPKGGSCEGVGPQSAGLYTTTYDKNNSWTAPEIKPAKTHDDDTFIGWVGSWVDEEGCTSSMTADGKAYPTWKCEAGTTGNYKITAVWMKTVTIDPNAPVDTSVLNVPEKVYWFSSIGATSASDSDTGMAKLKNPGYSLNSDWNEDDGEYVTKTGEELFKPIPVANPDGYEFAGCVRKESTNMRVDADGRIHNNAIQYPPTNFIGNTVDYTWVCQWNESELNVGDVFIGDNYLRYTVKTVNKENRTATVDVERAYRLGDPDYEAYKEPSGKLDFAQTISERGYTCSVVELKDSMKNAGAGALEGCESVTEIKLNKEMKVIPPHAFRSCKGLRSIEFVEGVTTISTGAFGFCDDLTTLQLPASVTSIGEQAFFRCKALTSIQQGDDSSANSSYLTQIGSRAFKDCPKIDTIVLGKVDVIAEGAFWNGMVERSVSCKVTFWGDVGEIQGSAFRNANISSLKFAGAVGLKLSCFKGASFGTIEFASTTHQVDIPDIFDGDNNRPSSIDKLTFCGPVGEIAAKTFRHVKIGSLSFKKGVKSIGSEAFAGIGRKGDVDPGVKTLEGVSLEFGGAVGSIGDSAFRNSGLKGVAFNNGEKELVIGDRAFEKCEIVTLELPSKTKSLGTAAFMSNHDLTTVSSLGSIEALPAQAFASCGALKNIKLPEGLTSIGQDAFNKCTSLKEISIPTSVAQVGANAFSCTIGPYSIHIFVNGTLSDNQVGELGRDMASADGTTYHQKYDAIVYANSPGVNVDDWYRAGYKIAEHTVSFDMNGYGEQIPAQTVWHNYSLDKKYPDDPVDPTGTYVFKGWERAISDSEGQMIGVNRDTPIDADVTLRAIWGSKEVQKVNVTVHHWTEDSNKTAGDDGYWVHYYWRTFQAEVGSAFVVEPMGTGNSGTAMPYPFGLSKVEGGEANTEPDWDVEGSAPETVIVGSSDMVLNLYYKRPQRSLEFIYPEVAPPGIAVPEKKEYRIQELVDLPYPDPVPGWTFKGWNLKSGWLGNLEYPLTAEQISMGSQNSVLEGQWERHKTKWTVQYLDGNGSDLETPKELEGYVGDSVTEVALDIFGYELVSDASQTITLGSDADSNCIDFIYQAKKTTVTFDGNGGTGGPVGTEKEFTFGKPLPTVVIDTAMVPPTGKKLDGWYTAVEGGYKIYNADGSVAGGEPLVDGIWHGIGGSIPVSLELHARWIGVDYTVQYIPGDGIGEPFSQKVTYADGGIFAACTFDAPSAGMSFAGWSVHIENGDQLGVYAAGSAADAFDVADGSKLIAEATWALEGYRVVFEAGGGSFGDDIYGNPIVAIGADLIREPGSQIDIPAPTRPDHAFMGWGEKAADGSIGDIVEPDVTATRDVTYVAKWDQPSFLVTFKGGASGAEYMGVYQGGLPSHADASEAEEHKAEADYRFYNEALGCVQQWIQYGQSGQSLPAIIDLYKLDGAAPVSKAWTRTGATDADPVWEGGMSLGDDTIFALLYGDGEPAVFTAEFQPVASMKVPANVVVSVKETEAGLEVSSTAAAFESASAGDIVVTGLLEDYGTSDAVAVQAQKQAYIDAAKELLGVDSLMNVALTVGNDDDGAQAAWGFNLNSRLSNELVGDEIVVDAGGTRSIKFGLTGLGADVHIENGKDKRDIAKLAYTVQVKR